MLKKAMLLFLILCMLIIMVGCGGNPIIPPVEEEGNIQITDIFWNSDAKVIEITLNQFPSTWGDWTMYINGEKLSMEGGTGNPVVAPNADLDEPPTGLYVGTLPWLSPLTEVDFPCCGTIQFDIPGEGLTNEYEFNLINFGCETASEEECSQTPIPSPDPEEEAIIPDTTKIIDEETKEQVVEVTPDQSVITFAQSTPQLEELKVGDIIIMGVTDQTPYGLLRKVTGINKGATKYSPVFFYLGFGTLEEAIQKGQWEYSQTLKPEDIEKGFVFSEGIQPAREKISTSLDFEYPINEILYDQDNDPATTENNITATGYIAFDYQVTFDGEIDGHTLKHFIFENIIETDSKLNISVGASVSIADLGDVADVTIGKPIPFTPVTVYIPTPIPFVFIPLVFFPSIELKVGIEGKATIKLEAGITQTTKYTAGIEFTEGDWKNITDPLPKIVNTMELADPEGTIHVTAHVGPQLNCKLYKAAGPYCNIFGYLDFDADISSNPWWDLDAMLTVTAGVKMDLLSIHWDSGELPLFDPLLRFDVAEADGPFGGGANHPPIISSLTANPSSVDINQTTTITCIASDPDGDPLTYHWTKNAGSFEGSTSGPSVTWRGPSSTDIYTVVGCEVSDGEGGEDSESINIIVTESDDNHAPVITSTPVTSATKDEPYSYDVNATDSDGDTRTYSLTTKPDGMTISSSTGMINWTPAVTGDFNVTVKVSDNGSPVLSDTQSFTITVEENGTYTITASAGSHGSISPSGSITVNQGSDKSFTITPDTGYSIDDVLVDGSSVGAVSSYTFTNVTEDHTISATFIIVPSGTYDLRDIGPAGGYIFYDKGSYSNGWRYLEAAPVSTEWKSKQWGSYGTFIGGTEKGVGTGQSNTTTIVTWLNSHSETGKAAQLCDALVYGGYSDWFLPSKDELNLIYENLYLFGVGGFATYIAYWSSSEYNAHTAWSQFFAYGYQTNPIKDGALLVRAVRAF